MNSLQARVDQVKSSISSPSECTPAIVATLNELLLSDVCNQSQANNGIAKTSLKASLSTQSKASTALRAGAKISQASRREDVKQSRIELSLKEKAVLATEVINGTLAALGAPSKSQHAIRRPPSSTDLRKASARKTLCRSNSLPHSPLQTHIFERASSSPDINTRSNRSSSSASTTVLGHRAIAECSRIAFTCLRALQASRAPCIMDLKPLQLENGMTALIGRFVMLGFDDLALKELRILKRRLDTALKTSGSAVKRTRSTESIKAVNVGSQTLIEILDFETPPVGGPLLALTIATQMHALKLMASSKKPSLITAVVSKLQVGYSSSPIQLLLQSAKESPSQKERAAKQLENLSRLILSFTPNISSSEDSVALTPKLNAAPEVVLQLQILGFHSRVLWWKLCDHHADIEKEFLEPFSRCLASFTRRSQCEAIERYKSATQAFEAIQEIGSQYQDSMLNDHLSQLASIYKLLGSLAQDAARFVDAIRWMETVEEIHRLTGASETCRWTAAANLLSLKLQISPQDAKVEDLLMSVLEALGSSLKGNCLELDELILEISKARRAAVIMLSKGRPGLNGKRSCHIPDGIRQMCESLVLLCPRFSLKYLSKPPDLNAATKSIVRYEQRRQFLAKSTSNTIDSALFLVKVFQSENRLTWELMDSTLKDCLALLEGVGANNTEYPNGSIAAVIESSYFVRISNLYFTQHLNMRRDADGPKDIQHLRPLRKSIECVQTRPAMERQAAFLNSKLERIADIYKSFGRLDDARNALVTLRDELIANGVLSAVAAKSCSKPLRASWYQNEDASMLARAIGLLLKLELRLESKSERLPYSDVQWSVEERGVMLEHALNVLSKQSKDSMQLQKGIFRDLLVIYDPTSFPIRRLRVATYLLRLDPEHRRDLAGDVKSALTLASLESIAGESEDTGLRPYLPHLRALASSILELQEEHPRIDLLKPHLVVWRSILDDCKDYESLVGRVDEIYDLTSHLHSVADFLHMKGLGKIRVAVLRIIASINEIPRPDLCPDDPVLSYIALGQQYLELGYSGKAGLSFDRARSHASANGVTIEALLRVQLSYAEYLLAIGNSDKCEEVLFGAQTIAANDSSISAPFGSYASLSDRIRVNRLFAEASFVHSLLALERGALQTALGYAKRNVRLIRRAWNIIELQTKTKGNDARKGYVESIVEDFSNLSVSAIKPAVPSTGEQAPGPSAWALVNPLFRGLSHLSKVYAHHGMFRETIYYSEQAYKLVKDLGSEAYSAWALAMTGGVWLNAGTLDTASDLLMQAKELSISSGESHASVVISCYLGKLHRLLDNAEAELGAYDDAQMVLETLMGVNYINNIDRILDPATMLKEEMCKMTLKASKPTGPRKGARKKTVSTRKTTPVAKIPAETCSSTPGECLRLSSLRGLLLRQKASAFILWKRCDEASNALKEASTYSSSLEDNIDQHISFAKQLLFQSMEQMTGDPVFGVLQDSTISFPAIASLSRATGSGLDRAPGTHLSPSAKPQATTGGWGGNRSKSPCSKDFFDKLRQAQEHLTEAHSMALQASSTAVIHNLSSLLNTITIFLSAAGSAKGKSSVHPIFSTNTLEMARNLALQRERKAILADPNSSNQKGDDLRWPIDVGSDLKRSSNGLPHDILRFQKDYVDIIPPTWTAISMSLSENRQELYLTKMQAGQTPFILRLPIARNNSRDVDEQVFDFGQGKTELQEIIDQANFSAHSARELCGREAKTAWWEERGALDIRLKDLLENIERVWLGGFKGVFSQQQRRPDLLARFQKSFQNILDKHLPSRQKTRKKSKTGRVTLDARILELFIGLGDSSGDDCDLDEALTDLLYFVIDVLQFHGERNAYDEIDFDSIVIETQDALRSYREAAFAVSSSNEDRHTILILDKALHAFPWESLPCMNGLAVSRLPSLGCLRERLLDQQRSAASGPEGHYINRENGAYILNPGGDLRTTQATFESDLQSLGTWTSIVKSEPSESDIKENLKTKDLYLYFGHGSGSQYIRAKTIKSLEKCAVTILMGCSSGALSDTGEFEPYGPPIDYMLAGCPSLVATLWDVTDKDIDRFAKSMFEHWGLFKSQEPDNEQVAKGKGRGDKKLKESSMSEKVSLIEAVVKARKACNFRYLTAAAVCVYGIPVYFK